MTPTLRTSRLILQPLTLADHVQVQELFPFWEIVRYLNDRIPWPFPEDGVLNYYRESALPAIARNEEWHWTIRLQQKPNQIIGAIGLFTGENNRGFWLCPQWHGQGLMTEAVIAANDFWFDVLQFPILRVPKAAANLASRRISEKTGMRLVATGEGNYVCGRLPSETWEQTSAEWHAWRNAITSPQPGDPRTSTPGKHDNG